MESFFSILGIRGSYFENLLHKLMILTCKSLAEIYYLNINILIVFYQSYYVSRLT